MHVKKLGLFMSQMKSGREEIRMKLLKIGLFLVGIFFILSAFYGYISTKSLYIVDILLGLFCFIILIVLTLKNKRM